MLPHGSFRVVVKIPPILNKMKVRRSQSFHTVVETPVEEGLVFRAEDYVFSSAIDYAGGRSLLDDFVIE